MQQRFVLDILAPVPVGHRVQIQFYERLTDDHRDVLQRKPEVTDVDTGVRYVPAELHSTSTASSWFDASCWRDQPDPSYVKPGKTLGGRVAGCSVATPPQYPGFATVLVVDVLDERQDTSR
jgi:hypothetical protein